MDGWGLPRRPRNEAEDKADHHHTNHGGGEAVAFYKPDRLPTTLFFFSLCFYAMSIEKQRLKRRISPFNTFYFTNYSSLLLYFI